MSEINSLLASEYCVRVAADDPEKLLDIAAELFESNSRTEQLLAVDFNLSQYWRDDPSAIALTALYYLQRINNRSTITIAVIESAICVIPQLTAPLVQRSQQSSNYSSPIDEWLQSLSIPFFRLDKALLLQPIAIPKPWGQEIWYTGIERRGVAEVSDGRHSVALPWLLSIAPRRLLSGHQTPILLKILDPLPEPVFGDLYFEMHQQKQEVYVVTAIDRQAWPAGTGAIRFGFNAELRAQYGDDKLFVEDYLNAVRAYREVRKAIDEQLDLRREQAGIDLGEPLPAATLQVWLADLPVSSSQREHQLREAMERFTALRSLRIGDVVKVPCLLPHSLQHGVRTVEFQTPVYERLILSFAQKVLTQTDWDTEAAASLIRMDPPPLEPWPITARGEGWSEEQIVEFDDFEVRRIALQPGSGRYLESDAQYALLMAVGAGLQLEGAPLAGDSALLLPSTWTGAQLFNNGRDTAYLLLAKPRAARG